MCFCSSNIVKMILTVFSNISYLLVAKQNNKLLMKNYEIFPTSFALFPKVNVTVHNNYENENIEIMIIVVIEDFIGD